jgi:hypothetical protein
VPIDDEVLERAVRTVAPNIDTDDVMARVAAKRRHRRAGRHLRTAALVAVTALVAVSGVVLVARDDDPTRVITPASPASKVERIMLDRDEGYLRAPLTMSGDLVSVAAYDHDGRGGYDFPPSRIVRFDPRTLRVVDRIDLKAEILSVVDGLDGVRWAVTRNKDPDGPAPAGHFLKRIAANGDVQSIPLPPGTASSGDLHVFGNDIVVPTGSGQLVFDDRGRFVLDALPPPAPLRPARPKALSQVRGTDVSFVWSDAHTVYATVDGGLVRIPRLPTADRTQSFLHAGQ